MSLHPKTFGANYGSIYGRYVKTKGSRTAKRAQLNFFNAKLNLCCNPPELFVALLPSSAVIKTFVLGAECCQDHGGVKATMELHTSSLQLNQSVSRRKTLRAQGYWRT